MIFVRLAIGRRSLAFDAYSARPLSRSMRIAAPAWISGGSVLGGGVRRTDGNGDGDVPPPGTGTGVGGGGSTVCAAPRGTIATAALTARTTTIRIRAGRSGSGRVTATRSGADVLAQLRAEEGLLQLP